MFSLNGSTDPNPTNTDPNNALPNNYGKIRTLKEDFENNQSGRKIPEAEVALPTVSPPVAPAPKEINIPLSPPPHNAPKPVIPLPNHSVSNPPQIKAVQPVATPPAKPTDDKKIPAPLGTESFFSGHSPFEQLDQINKKNEPEKFAQKKEKKSLRPLLIIVVVFLVLAALGGGIYYYLFASKPQPAAEKNTAGPQTPASPSADNAPSASVPNGTEPANSKVRALVVDPSAGQAGFKQALKNFAENFSKTAAENDLLEIRPVGKDNQQISSAAFLSLSSIALPENVTRSFSGADYGIFIKKENGEIRTGLVFKLSDTANIRENMALQEKTLIPSLNVLYLEEASPSASYAFNSSKYKNADIRYYNFPEPINTSLDYSVISGTSEGYLIFGNSKNTIRSILDYMSEK